MAEKYNPQSFEKKWQDRWVVDGLSNTGDNAGRPKMFILDMFPYPSGDGLSVGHARNYCLTDVYSRYFRMRGYNVLHPMGFDAFGLPAENAAIKLKTNPMVLNKRFTANFKRQMDMLGLSYDWDRCVNSCDPDYYRWTQWIFLRIFNAWYDPRANKARPIDTLIAELEVNGTANITEAAERAGLKYPLCTAEHWKMASKKQKNEFLMHYRLAYRGDSAVNWDPVDKVVVANEEVENGRAWRSGALVEKKILKQWFFRITAYADRLQNDLSTLDWPAKIVTMQRNWIGKSEGAEVKFKIDKDASDADISVFTTRPDTLWGATFMVLSPEHPLVNSVTSATQKKAVEDYVNFAKSETEEARTDANKEKTGVFTGGYAINPVNEERIPIWIADYVMMGYGTGAIMAVPAHDQRDFEFAKKFGLPIRMVVRPPGMSSTDVDQLQKAYEDHYDGQGEMVNSGPLNGLDAGKALEVAIRYVEQNGVGKRRANYRLRDWLISRQRYWGTPIPIVHTDEGEMALSDEDLPVLLPDVESYNPTATGESPLAIMPEFVNVELRDAHGNVVKGRRETDTMAAWACSSWYFLRFADPHNVNQAFDPVKVAEWLPVDTYVGGAEHAVLHLLYSRMWTKVLYDLGYIKFVEPFKTLRNQGLILAAEPKTDPETGRQYYEKMSKSKGNVITPDEVVEESGADALRGYEMFISDFNLSVPWNANGVIGVRRWLERVWRIVLDPNDDAPSNVKAEMTTRDLLRYTHKTIDKVGRDIETFSFNTVVAALMEFTNNLYKARDAGLVGTIEWYQAIDNLLRMIAPVAPHMSEELWHRMGNVYSIHQQPFPFADIDAMKDDEITIVIQVNGKVRDRVTVSADLSDDEIKQSALKSDGAKKFMGDKPARQVVYVKGRLVNIVI
jgi:leucyl-tRNA synthetase